MAAARVPADAMPKSTLFDELLLNLSGDVTGDVVSSSPPRRTDGQSSPVNDTVVPKIRIGSSDDSSSMPGFSGLSGPLDPLDSSRSGNSIMSSSDVDVPPLPLDYPRSDSDLLKLQKRRIHNERVRVSLISEQEAFDSLMHEEELLVKRANKTTDLIHALVEKSQHLDQRYIAVEELYRANQEKLKLLQNAVEGISKQWQQEATEFNTHSGRLQRLRGQKSKLDIELVEVSGQCAALTTRLTVALQGKGRLAVALSRVTKENESVAAQINFTDKDVQTNFSFTVLDDIQNIHTELEKQRTTMKNVREAIELIKRCT